MQPIVRAFTVLRILAATEHGLTLQEISERAAMPLTSTHRIVAVLAELRYVTRSPTNRRYYLGPATRELSERAPARGPLGGNRVLDQAARESEETVFLTELIDGRAVCVALVEAARPLRLFVRIGQELPLHAAASARVLLADLPDADVRRMLTRRPLTAFTPATPLSVDAILERLVHVRAHGYDVCDHELDAGVWAAAAAVRSSMGAIRAALAIAAPGVRVQEPEDRERLVGIASGAAAELSADLGFEPLSGREP
jgi:DNA-binding IclR family transcriptional regulator